MSHEIAELLLPDVTKTPAEVEAQYPYRPKMKGAVTRFAPSPTGFLHIGGLFAALINRRAATGQGICYLRIEDTDKKREVQDGVSKIISGLDSFAIAFDEGVTGEGTEQGAYGPYTQSKRRELYRTYAKALVERDLAYPCFCSSETLAQTREKQEAAKINTGYYGPYAVCRNLTDAEVKAKIKEGIPFVLRLKSPGDGQTRIAFNDTVKGKIEMPENVQDIVLLKSDGVPTYHFAHAVDDRLMGTTHVIRGDEWISSAPIHLQLFQVLGFRPPQYAHISPIMKEENGHKRKLSKRKDPEAAVDYYTREGYPADSVIEYLLSIANSGFEDWRRQNPGADTSEFPFNLKKMSLSGALFDLAKLDDVSRNVISVLPAAQVNALASEWARQYDPALYDSLTKDPLYSTAVFGIDRTPVKPRKDIAKWSQVRDYLSYMFDALWDRQRELPANVTASDAAGVIRSYLEVYDCSHDKDQWFAQIKSICQPNGFAPEVKEYRQNPEGYKGHVGDVSGIIRVAVTGRINTPDLHAIMTLLGKEAVEKRLGEFLDLLKRQTGEDKE